MNFFFKNQELLTNQNNVISIKERGFMFGDGLFESCKIYNGKIYNFNEHLSRLNRGLKALKINFSTANLEKQCLFTIKLLNIAILFSNTEFSSSRNLLPPLIAV